ncbi:Transposase IS4 [Popillia japonica]|uniref:Transposase IS4 n=1 Tax=Popillia japonica TaxID=7064 RepID=A0AAW1HV79_POPJA
MISSMHDAIATDTESGKSEIIAAYYQTKGGVDSLDQKCANYSTSRRTRRWPMAIFYSILDIAGVNAFILYGSYRDNVSMLRIKFMKMLSFELVQDHLNKRLVNERLPRSIRLNIGTILRKPVT